MARIRSVLVGVDVYERPEVPRLNGCVNDVRLVRRILKSCFGIPNDDIRVLVNERATREAILGRLRDTVRSAEAGDVVVFYYSGHGSQVRDRDGDELSDHLDELLVPYDMDWERRRYILDDDIDEILGEARADVLVEAFFDCCFFGAGPRDLGSKVEPRPLRRDIRYLPPPFDIACRAEGDEDIVVDHGFAQCRCFHRNVRWSATAEGQQAAEDYFGGRAHGVFTYWGCRFIEENLWLLGNGEYTREQLLDDVRSYVRSLGYPQTAELGARPALREVGPFTRADAERHWLHVGRSARGWSRRRQAGPR